MVKKMIFYFKDIKRYIKLKVSPFMILLKTHNHDFEK